MKTISLGKRKIGDGQSVFLIAEIGGNHNHDKKYLKKLIDACADSGFDAVKFQTFRGAEVTNKKLLTAEYEKKFNLPNPKKLKYWYSYLDAVTMNYNWYPEVFDYAHKKGLIPFSTPSSVEGAKFLLELGVPCFKVASMDVNFTPFFEELAAFGKPIIFSIGMGTVSEIDKAVRAIRSKNNDDIVVTHCVANYPAKPEELNLRVLPTIRDMWGVLTGFSDHSIGTASAVAAVALGACVIEKHVTLDRKDIRSPDHFFALEPAEMRSLVAGVREVEKSLGQSGHLVNREEHSKRGILLRSIVARKPIRKGTKLKADMYHCVNPGTGIAPCFMKTIEGMTVKKAVAVGEPITWEHF